MLPTQNDPPFARPHLFPLFVSSCLVSFHSALFAPLDRSMPMRQTLGCNCGLHMRIHHHIKQSFEASRAVDDPTTCAKPPTRSPLTLIFLPHFRCAGRSLLPPGAGRGGPRLPRGWQVSRQGPVRDLSRAANRPASRAKSNARERGKLTLSRRHQHVVCT